MILVVGATGVLGGLITRMLLDEGKQVRVLVRENSPSEELAQAGMATPASTLIEGGAVPVTGDLKDPDSLAGAVEGVETVITTANSALRGGDDNVQSVDADGNRALIDASKRAGINHFVFISALGADPNSPVPLLRAKGETEQYLRESGLTYTIIAANVFMEVWTGMVVVGPVMGNQPVTLVGAGDHRHTFVSLGDVATFAVRAVDHPAATNQTLVIAGPEALTWTEVVDVFSRVIGREIPVNYVSVGEPVPGLPEAVLPLMYNFESYETPIEMAETANTFGVELTSVETFARRAMAGPTS